MACRTIPLETLSSHGLALKTTKGHSFLSMWIISTKISLRIEGCLPTRLTTKARV